MPLTRIENDGIGTVTTLTVAGPVSGNGQALTSLNASALSVGTVPLGRLASANSSANGVVDTTTQTFAGDKTFVNNVTVTGNLTVLGTAVTLNSENVLIKDNILTLSSNVTGTPVLDAGIEVNRGTSANVTLKWNETSDRWQLTNDGSTYENIVLPSTVANSSANGVVSTTTQTFAGDKTFQNTTSFSNTVSITGAANTLSTLGVAGTLSALGQLSVTGNATFDTSTLFVDATNDLVGIGTTTPSARLHIVRSANTVGDAIKLYKGSDTHQAWLSWAQGGETSATWRLGYTGSSYDLQFLTGNSSNIGTEIMRLGANGNLGVGTTSPTSKLHINDGALAVETATSVSNNFNWYSATDSDNQVIVTDNNQLYIKKLSGSDGYGYFTYWPEKVGKNFNLSFRLKGGTPASGYRHVAIAIASDGGSTTNNFDYVVFRHNVSNTALNQIRVDVAGSTQESYVSSNVPNFWDGTERRILIKVRNNFYIVEVDGTLIHTMKATTRTRASGVIGFAIYEGTTTNTHITISNFKIEHLQNADSVTPAWNLRPDTSTDVTLSGSQFIGWTSSSSGSSSKGCFYQGITLTGSAAGTANATNTGRINFPVAGKYKIWVTIRMENTSSLVVGNIYLYINGVQFARQHVEAWGAGPYYHGFHSHIIDVAANDYLEIYLARNGGIFSGTNDIVNWCGGHLIKEI